MEMRSTRVPWSIIWGLLGGAALALGTLSGEAARAIDIEATPPDAMESQEQPAPASASAPASEIDAAAEPDYYDHGPSDAAVADEADEGTENSAAIDEPFGSPAEEDEQVNSESAETSECSESAETPAAATATDASASCQPEDPSPAYGYPEGQPGWYGRPGVPSSYPEAYYYKYGYRADGYDNEASEPSTDGASDPSATTPSEQVPMTSGTVGDSMGQIGNPTNYGQERDWENEATTSDSTETSTETSTEGQTWDATSARESFGEENDPYATGDANQEAMELGRQEAMEEARYQAAQTAEAEADDASPSDTSETAEDRDASQTPTETADASASPVSGEPGMDQPQGDTSYGSEYGYHPEYGHFDRYHYYQSHYGLNQEGGEPSAEAASTEPSTAPATDAPTSEGYDYAQPEQRYGEAVDSSDGSCDGVMSDQDSGDYRGYSEAYPDEEYAYPDHAATSEGAAQSSDNGTAQPETAEFNPRFEGEPGEVIAPSPSDDSTTYQYADPYEYYGYRADRGQMEDSGSDESQPAQDADVNDQGSDESPSPSGLELFAWRPGELLLPPDQQVLRNLEALCQKPSDIRREVVNNYVQDLGTEAADFASRFENFTGIDTASLGDDLPGLAAFLASYRLVQQGELGMDEAVLVLERSLHARSREWAEGVAEITAGAFEETDRSMPVDTESPDQGDTTSSDAPMIDAVAKMTARSVADFGLAVWSLTRQVAESDWPSFLTRWDAEHANAAAAVGEGAVQR